MSFDPKRYLIKVQGNREYLPVSARLIWFRSEHPDWGIVTEAVEINHEKQFAVFRASIFNEEGRLIATATKKEDVKGFGDFIEKAETGSVGRALAMCGYGAQFAPELEENGPRRGGASAAPRMAPPPPGPSSYGPPQRVAPTPQAAPPIPRPAAPVLRDEMPPPFDEDEAPRAPQRPLSPPQARPQQHADIPSDLPLRPASSLSRPAPRPLPSEPAPLHQVRPAPAGGSIQRVREPERNTPDPGGNEELDDLDDPFADEDAPPPPPRAAARPPARPAPRQPGGDTLL
ncbi:hypothetical protein [Armatimonas sp.]|uniref:hypothetical protein n=1 Tax=Armatimonas sp. TaxID=1872638 RepID=UPI003752E8F5